MPIYQELLLMILMLNSVITVSQMHIPSKTHFEKAVVGYRHSSVVIRAEWKWYQIKLCLNSSHYMQKKLRTVSIYWEASIFISVNRVLTLFCFLKTMCCTWPSRIRFSIVILCCWVLERCPGEYFKDCHRQPPKLVVWIHSLAFTPQPKEAIISHRKRCGWYRRD